MTFGKRQLVIASLVVALGAAVYLNWQFSGNDPIAVSDTKESSYKQLGQTTYVNTELDNVQPKKTTAESSTPKLTDTTKAVNADESAVDTGHFAAERKKRSQSDSKAVESLSEIIESASATESAKKEAVAAAERLAKCIKAQSDIESEIKVKGFEDVLVLINNESCNVSVFGGTLDDAAAIVIKDIVNRQGGISFEKITVAQVK